MKPLAGTTSSQIRHMGYVLSGSMRVRMDDGSEFDLGEGDVVQHVPGHGPFAGTYKGVESVLGYYGKLAQITDGTFRADLVEVHGDGWGHVCATHQISATRNGAKRVTRGAILSTCVGDKVTDLLEMHADLPGDDASFS